MRTTTHGTVATVGIGLAALLISGRGPAAADRPAALVSPASAPVAEPPSTNPAPYLQAILGQLVLMNSQLQHALGGAEKLSHACRYEDRSYTEGAILKVSGIALVCVERDWGATGSNDEEVWIWEPAASPRLEKYRKATGLRASL